jgi:L,D-peptidoglycan transpeptidase YkuD (ErfK/YbiS/YcfS/YnhG family)
MPRRLDLAVTCAVGATLVACTSHGSPAPATTSPLPSAHVSTGAASPVRNGVPSAARSTHPSSGKPNTHPVRSRTQPAAARTGRPSAPASVRPSALPLAEPTGSARQVVTVVAGATTDVQATLQTWQQVSGGWRRVGPAVPAWLGSAGLTSHPSESLSATPIGSFTLTQAFGHNPDPGTRLPYVHTTPADWWISQAGPLYNTMQRCAGQCAFTQGDPNEHLYYETPYYDYAVVIDYNRDPVVQGAGSAFFLHVTVGAPTAGCVSIPQDQLVRIMRWLDPSEHPRILIGTA